LFFNFLQIKLAPETTTSKKKVGFIFHPLFLSTVGSGIRDLGSGALSPPGSGIRDEKVRDPDPG
jgi:hypothetical protein